MGDGQEDGWRRTTYRDTLPAYRCGAPMPRRSLLSATVNRARRYQAPVSQSYIYICIIYITYIGLRAQRTRCSRRLRCGPSLHLSRRARIRPSVPQTDTRWRWDVPFDLFSLPVAPLCRPSLFNAALSQPWQRNKSRFRPSHGESRAIPTGVFRRVTSCNPPPPPTRLRDGIRRRSGPPSWSSAFPTLHSRSQALHDRAFSYSRLV